MARKAAGKTVSYMDEDSDDDFVLEAPTRKKKTKGNRTSTQDTGLAVAPVGRGGRSTARVSKEEVQFQQQLQEALRVSQEEEEEEGVGPVRESKEEEDSDEDFDFEPAGFAPKKIKAVAEKVAAIHVKSGGDASKSQGVIEVDVESQQSVPHGMASADTIILEEDEEDVKVQRRRPQVLDSEDEETEVAKKNLSEVASEAKESDIEEAQEVVPQDVAVEAKCSKKEAKRKVAESWVVGSRQRRESGDRARKKPKRYVESSESEDGGGRIESEDEEEVESARRKKALPKKSPAKKGRPAGKTLPNKTTAKSVAPELSHPAPSSPARPLGTHNPPAVARSPAPASSPARASSVSSFLSRLKGRASVGGPPSASSDRPPSSTVTAGASNWRPQSSRDTPGAISVHQSPGAARPKVPAWNPPSRLGGSPSPLPASPGLSPSIRRLGLSRNFRSPAPLHKNLKLN